MPVERDLLRKPYHDKAYDEDCPYECFLFLDQGTDEAELSGMQIISHPRRWKLSAIPHYSAGLYLCLWRFEHKMKERVECAGLGQPIKERRDDDTGSLSGGMS